MALIATSIANALATLLARSPARAAGAVCAIALATLAGAWAFEYVGYAPCDLCLKQRWAYYAGAPLAATAALVAWSAAPGARILLWLVALVFAGSAAFGVYHAGVEWGFWPGPTGCSGASLPPIADMNDFLKQLQSARVVRCDEVALRILGLSLAGWNALISSAMATLAAIGARAEPA